MDATTVDGLFTIFFSTMIALNVWVKNFATATFITVLFIAIQTNNIVKAIEGLSF